MNELRWILLIAGALLIAGIYAWGLRSRSRAPLDARARRPAVFSGGATGFEAADTRGDPLPDDRPAGSMSDAEPDPRRLERSRALDDEAIVDTQPAIERRAQFEHRESDDRDEPAAASRREPTLGPRVDAAPGSRVEPVFAPRTTAPATAPRTDLPPTELVPEVPASLEPTAAVGDAVPAKARRPAQKIFAVRVGATGSARFTGQQVLDALQVEGLAFGRYDIFHRLHDDGRPVFSVASLRDPGTFDPATMPAMHYPGVLVFTVLPGPVHASDAFDEMLFTARALATHLGGALADDKGVPLTAHRAGRLREEAIDFERTAGAA